MGKSKWLKSLVGIQNSNKNSSTENGQNAQVRSEKVEKSKFWRKRSSRAKKSIYKDMFEKYGPLKEEKAAICIQTQFRGYLAKKKLRSLKGMVRLRAFVKDIDTRKQASNALCSMQSWVRLQSQIQARRSCMVTEARIRQKKREHQLKLEAELHGLEVDWLDGTETMEEILARVHNREEAALKRERALAYAFSHQWRPTSKNQKYSGYELDKTNWGWSWLERWVAARPWENRIIQSANMKEGVRRQIASSFKNGQTNGKVVSLKVQQTKTSSNQKESTNKTDSEIKNSVSSNDHKQTAVPQENGNKVAEPVLIVV